MLASEAANAQDRHQHFVLKKPDMTDSHLLRCPLCRSPLLTQERAAVCAQGHHFDRAKEGYFNLLPVQHKNSLNPGDDADMVRARQAFLEAGFYTPFREAILGYLAPLRPQHLLDSGCGEGWYTQAFQTIAAKTTAFDISKDAIRRAAKRQRELTWLVASSHDIPLPDATVDVMTAIFSSVLSEEAARVMKPGAHLLIAAPGEDHLWEMREALYEEVRPHHAEKWMDGLAKHFHFAHEMRVQFTLTLDQNEHLQHLLSMTPHYWRANREKRAALAARAQFSTRADFRLLMFQRHA